MCHENYIGITARLFVTAGGNYPMPYCFSFTIFIYYLYSIGKQFGLGCKEIRRMPLGDTMNCELCSYVPSAYDRYFHINYY